MAPKRKPTASNSSTDEKNKRSNDDAKPDLISELPDSILHHILSFLDIKHAIPTSLLSRRWRFVWTSLPFLNISDEVYNCCKKPVEEPLGYDEYEEEREVKKTDFTDFVDRVLLMRDRSSDISSCRFSYNESDIDEKKILGDIYLWIHVLVRCNVQFFDLCIGSLPEQINLPHCLFNCKSLTTLKLDMGPKVDVDYLQQPKFNLPTELGMNLPALRVLQLRFLSIVGDVGKLISSCPVLETLIISRCEVNLSGKQLNICCPVLETLIISKFEINSYGRQLNISASQLKKLVIEEIYHDRSETDSLEYCKLKVFAPNLTSFRSRASPINTYSFVETSSLMNAEIETDEYAWTHYYTDEGKESVSRITWKQDHFKQLRKCFGGICNVRSLTLAAWLLTTHDTLWCPVPEDNVWEAELEPQVLMNLSRYLKLVEIWDILTSVNELEFLKFLLKNATVLEKLNVHTPKKKPARDNIKLKRFGENLKKFPTASSMAAISFL